MREYQREDLLLPKENVKNHQEVQQPPKQKKKDPVVEVWKTQVIICLLALALVGVLRFVGGDVYRNVRDKYIELFCDITTVEEVTLPQLPETPSSVAAMATVTPTAIPTMAETGGDTVDDRLAEKENMLLLTADTNWQNSMAVPVEGTVTSPFGYRIHPVYGTRLFHNGVDIGAHSGTPIVAALKGTVEVAEYNDSYGNYIVVNHGMNVKTVYAHCSELKAKIGQGVEKGEEIALVGSTGVSTGPHLHFEVRRGEYRVNPEWLVKLR